jgi:predicted enzyme related to lactoylglutathione lyase
MEKKMKIKLTSVFVDDQEKALRFYTEVMGFVKKADVKNGDYRWLTVVSPEGPNDMELLLEPNNNPVASTYQKAIYESGIPANSFSVDNLQEEYERLSRLGVKFVAGPVTADWGAYAMIEDTCGNLINLHQI